jgi:hypothetical protein
VNAREVTAADIARLLRELGEAAKSVGKSLDEVLDIEHICQETGIPQERVHELLSGEEPRQPPRDATEREAFYRELGSGRLQYLRELAKKTHEADDKPSSTSPQPGSLRTIGSIVGLSKQVVDNLVKGKRSFREEYSRPLEEYYGVDHGYLSKPEGPALADYLKKQINGVYAGAMHRRIAELNGGQVAFRSMGETPSMREMVKIMDELLAARRQGGRTPDVDGQGCD